MADTNSIELTDEQKAVVDHGKGPLLVNGGPGSGKTRVIVERVARLIESGISSPEQIFCMTFTKKATGEMAQRLKKIRDERQRQNGNALNDITNVRVGTIHSLGMDILKENSDITGITESTDIFDSLSKMAWCFKNADDMGINQDVLKMNPDGCAKALKGIQQAKVKMWSVADFREKINEFSERRARQGKSKTDESAGRMIELAKVYEAYEKHMKDRNMIDYEDMVGRAVELLRSREEIHERYADSYVIVDEFQDNNRAQFQLAMLLAGSGNLMVVGDRNQSIMDFQGAYAEIFDEFRSAYPEMVEMDLEKNHRCSENIQEAASILKSWAPNGDSQTERGPEAETELEDIKPRLFGIDHSGESDCNPPVLATIAADEETERQFVATATGLLVRNGVAEQDMAVLCRTNNMCRRFASTLRARGIRVAPENVGIPMSNPMVAEIMALLRIAASPETSGTEITLIMERRGILASNIRAINCTAKSMHRTRQNDRVFESLQKWGDRNQSVEIREIKDMILKLHAEAAKDGLQATLHDIMLRYTDAYRRNANGHTGESAANRAILTSIYRMANRYNRQHPYDTFSDFVEYVEFASDAIAKDPGLLDSSDGAELTGGVNVLTIHKSKGKEFGRVFVTGLNAPQRRNAEKGIIPAEMLHDTAYDAQASERNLLYVAITRAETGLYLSCPDAVNGKAADPLDFLNHMYGRQDTRRIAIPATAADVSASVDTQEARMREMRQDVCNAVLESRLTTAAGRLVELALVQHRLNNNAPDFDPSAVFDTGIDADRLLAALNVDTGRADKLPEQNAPLVDRDRLSLSFSAVKNYQECPRKFKYGKILGVPQRPSIYMDKGMIIHGALERLATGEVDAAEATRYARDEMDKIRCLHQDFEYRSAESSLEDAIRNYTTWEEKTPLKPKETQVEIGFETTIGGVRYTGRIDRIDTYHDGTYRLVDYKTGSSSISKKSIMQDGEDKTIRQPQVAIYAHAAKEMYNSPPAAFTFVYVDQGTKKDGCTLREYRIDGESLENGISIVEECTQDILAEKFEATPDKNICRRCPYKSICPEAIF